MTVKDLLTDGQFSLTKSEIKVVRELLSNYPAAGLTTVSQLARRAGVSDPTVVRLAHKLGFEGFVALQENLLAEVEEHLSSPLTMLAGRAREIGKDDVLRSCFEGATASLRSAGEEILPTNFEAATTLLADPRMRVCCLGGRFTRHLAGILKWHLQQLRARTELLEADVDLADRLVDMGSRDVLVVFDFRRYQVNVVQFAIEAMATGCKAILITDKWKSPIAQSADVVFTVPVEAVSPFDTMVPALALTEALIAAVTRRLEGKLGARLEAIEKYRSARNLTFESPGSSGPHGRLGPLQAPTAAGRNLSSRAAASDTGEE